MPRVKNLNVFNRCVQSKLIESKSYTGLFVDKKTNWFRYLLIAWITAFGWLVSGTGVAQDNQTGYQLGRGYRIAETGLQLGGYASMHLEGLGDTPWTYTFTDLSLFLTWDNGSRLRFFSELEAEDFLTITEHQGITDKGAGFRIERLYLDYLVNDKLTVRIGKMLTPVGQWNLIHADPLVWTATRPVATDTLFSEHITGVMAHGSIPVGDQTLDYSFYGDYSSSLDPRRTEPPYFDNAVGLRLRYHLNDSLKIGFSYVDYALTETTNIRNHLLGFDLAWSYQRFLVNSEVVYRNNNAAHNNNAWQGYIQGVSPLIGNFYGVGRYEFFDQNHGKTGQAAVFGLAYRPLPPLVWKLEYRFGKNNQELIPDGLFASFAVLF